ncbi:MAG: LamG-like jellyroll fold domain-containing protein, partial [Haloferula sp.]
MVSSLITHAQEVAPPTSVPLSSTLIPVFEEVGSEPVSTKEGYSNFRMVLDYDATEEANLNLIGDESVALPAGKGRKVELAYEHLGGSAPHLRVWVDGQMIGKGRDLDAKGASTSAIVIDEETSSQVLDLGRDFTVMAKFRGGQSGSLFSKSMKDGKWVRDAKALFLRDGRLVYDIGWVGELVGKTKLDPDKDYVAVLVSDGGRVSLYLDGKLEASKKGFASGDPTGSVFKVGNAATDFGGEFDGQIAAVRFWRRSLDKDEVGHLSKGREKSVNTPDFDWAPSAGGGEESSKFGEVPGIAIKPTLNPSKGFVL